MSTLYIIATPIGNLKDFSFRALDILRQVDLIACEDTRHAQKLLSHYHIDAKCIAYHAHNENEAANKCLQALQQNKTLALLSDAGTPLISDPGFHLVKLARDANIPVVPIPGACAFITALSAAGIPADKFIFEGFLPAKSQARQTRLKTLEDEKRTLIFYEAPHRIQEMIEDCLIAFGENREAAIARELTKIHETILKGPLKTLSHLLKQDSHQTKGEFVVIIAGIDKVDYEKCQHQKAQALLKELMSYLPLKKAVQIACTLTDAAKNELYTYALSLQKENTHDAKD